MINWALYPLSWLYGLGVGLRNKLFDRGWLRSESFDVPILCVGNLAVGGTGKTPHTEYLIRLLQRERLNVAVLSRGYKRKSRGYVLAEEVSNFSILGDEPCQMKQKFPDVRVAVDENRRHGIEQLMKLKYPSTDAIILDDAFQHRYVRAGVNILLTDYHRLWCDDALLPAGRLREPASGKRRAQIVIVTKCPENIGQAESDDIARQLRLDSCQKLYFSRFRYGELTPMFSDCYCRIATSAHWQILLVTGIASPESLLKEMKLYTPHVRLLAFGDHHNFTTKDLVYIKEEFLQLEEGRRVIVTTEKDAVRLKHHPALDEELKPYIHVLPIEVEILQDQQDTFNQNIIDYVRANTRNRSLPQREDAHTA